jgi:hypothetical protein
VTEIRKDYGTQTTQGLNYSMNISSFVKHKNPVRHAKIQFMICPLTPPPAKRKCQLHPLIQTIAPETSAQDVEKKSGVEAPPCFLENDGW